MATSNTWSIGSYRLLHKYVFTGFESFNANLDMPMVGSNDAYDVNIVAFQNFAVVFV